MSEKRWKKSEFIEKVQKIYGRDLGAVEADLLLPIIEEIHGPWLPEEPELPGKVNLVSDKHIYDVFTGDHLLSLSTGRPDRGELPFARAVVALWNALGPAGDLRKQLEDALSAFRPRDSDGEEFVSVRVTLLTALLAKPWEEPGKAKCSHCGREMRRPKTTGLCSACEDNP